MKRVLNALTIYQPYARLIAERVKLVENRDWQPPRTALVGYLAIHAGGRRDYDSWQSAAVTAHRAGLTDRVPWLAAVLRTDYRSRFTLMNASAPYSAIVAIARIARIETEAPPDDPWWFGRFGWRLSHVVPILPVTCDGRQGLWRVEAPLIERVRLAYKVALKEAA